MSHRNLEVVASALRSHRNGATVRDLSDWTNFNTNTPVDYRTTINCLATLHALGVARFDVESSNGTGTYTRRRWFPRKIVD